MTRLKDELTSKMAKLTLEKVALAQDASDVMSATAINAIVPLNCRRIMRQVTKKLKKHTHEPVRPNRVPYTQEHLTTALTYLVNCHFDDQPYSLRRAAKLFMDNKYASLTRVWKAHRMSLILSRFDRTHCLNFVATIEKPKVSACMFLIALLFACLPIARLFFFNSPPVVYVARACVQMGNPLWVNHVNRYHELIMISLIKYMALYNIPLVEEDACEMFRKLAVATARDEGRDLTKSGRWNGKRNADGTTTDNYATEIVCGSHFFRCFLARYPLVKNYRTSSMSIMRAKKATYEVFVFFYFSCLRI